jgi:hypothetical protein
VEFVDNSGCDEGTGEGGATLDINAANALGKQLREYCVGVVAWDMTKTAGVRANLGALWDLRVACHHRERLVIVEIAAGGSCGQTRVVDKNGVSSDHDRSVF